MRDIVVISYFAVLVVLALGRPHIALGLWVWTALGTPNSLTFGFSGSVRYNLIAAIITILSCLSFKRDTPVRPNASVLIALIFVLWTLLSTAMAIHDSSNLIRVLDGWLRGIVLAAMTLIIVRQKLHFVVIAWTIVLGIGLYSGIEGLKYFASAGSHRIVGPQNSNLHDNNHLAMAINMMLPFAIFLLRDLKKPSSRLAMLLFIATSILAVVGTDSRGGFAGLAIVLLSWAILSKRKRLVAPFLILGLIAGASFVPQTYIDRISTISEASEEGSFQSRVISWKQSTLIALDNPFTGGGFHAVQNAFVWERYSRDFHRLDFIDTEHASIYSFKAAHSIYFEVLGDHGFVGLFLFLLVFISSGIAAIRLSKSKPPKPELSWIPHFATACTLSLAAFAVSGALLSMAYFELAWLLVALISSLTALEKHSRSSPT